MKTKFTKLVTIVFLTIIPLLSLSAQDGSRLDALQKAAKQTTAEVFGNYSFMTKGQRSPFDTAVAVNIGQYRAETLKFDLCDSLITALQLITDNQSNLVSTLEKQVINLQELNAAYETEIERKNAVNVDLMNEYSRLSKAYSKERKWFKRNGKWLCFGVGVTVGGVVTYYIIK